jgi:hypothetical protein
MGDRQYNETVTFNPSININCYGDDKEFSLQFDFGLTCDFTFENRHIVWATNDSWERKIVEWVKFELDHSFFHTSIDPNYSTINYALFGCLCLNGRALTTTSLNSTPQVIKYIP